MRFSVDEQRLRSFMEEIGKSARSSGRIYLVGGSTALLLGIRSQTVDIDIKLDPEPAGVFEAIAELKEKLSINVGWLRPTTSYRLCPAGENVASSLGERARSSSSITTFTAKPSPRCFGATRRIWRTLER